MLAGPDNLAALCDVVERVRPQAVVLASPFPMLADQTRFPQDSQVVGDSGLTHVQDVLELGHVAFPLRQEFKHREPCKIRQGVVPLTDMRHAQR